MSKLIDELLVAVKVDLKGNRATLMSLKDIERQFFNTGKAAEKTDKAISRVDKNNGLKEQVGNAAQLLSQVTHTNNALHAMHTVLAKIGKTGTALKAVALVLGSFGAYKLSEQVGKYEQQQRLTDFTFGERSDTVRRQATDTAREFGTNEIDLLEGYRQMTKKGVGGSMQDVLLLQEAAKLENRTLASAVEAIADAQMGEFKRLKEYGIKGSTPRGGSEYRLLDAATGGVRMVDKNDPQEVRRVVMEMVGMKYGGALEATKETIPAKMQNVRGALWEGNESVWAQFAKGATDPIFEAWKDMSDDIISWIKEPEVQQAIYNIGRAVGEGVLMLGRLAQLLGLVLDKLRPVADFIMTTLGVIFDVAETGLNTLTAALTGDFEKASKAWAEWSEVIWLGLQLVVLKATNAFFDLIDAFVPGMEEARAFTTEFFLYMASKWEESKGWVTSAFDWVLEKWTEFKDYIATGFDNLIQALINKLSAPASWVNSLIGAPTGGSNAVPQTQVNATYNINGYSANGALAAARVNSQYLYG